MSAISSAWSAQADAVEIDVRISKDKELILYHDKKMNGSAISSMLFSEIQEENSQIPKLSSVLEVGVPRGYLLLDLKEQSQGYLNRIIKEIKASNMPATRIALQSQQIETLLYLRKSLPEARYIFLSNQSVVPHFSISNAEKLAKELSRNNIGTVSIKGRKYINKKYIDAFKALDITVNVWTINEISRATHYTNLGVSGIITDNIIELSEVVR